MNRRPIVQFMLCLLALCTLVIAAYAGGWAIITLNDFPDYAIAGKPLNLVFAVRQHGLTLLPGLQPRVNATSAGGFAVKANARAGATLGEYTATLTLPEPGEWTIKISSGFNTSATTLPTLKVIASGSQAPNPFSLPTRGLRLFTAKGCAACHRHIEVNPERTMDARFDLTGKRFPPDYLKKFLADPSIKPADMPNLKLKDDEIESLAAFIDKGLMKQVPQR